MESTEFTVRNAHSAEYADIGQLMVQVYSALDGFPKVSEQPEYYRMLANVGLLTERPGTEILAALSPQGKIAGAVVYFNDMQYYGSGGTATLEKQAAGFRLLAVDPQQRGRGIGKLLSRYCIERAGLAKRDHLVIHSTKAMQVAWKMYEKLGFLRAPDLDFQQGELPVYGFRLKL